MFKVNNGPVQLVNENFQSGTIFKVDHFKTYGIEICITFWT